MVAQQNSFSEFVPLHPKRNYRSASQRAAALILNAARDDAARQQRELDRGSLVLHQIDGNASLIPISAPVEIGDVQSWMRPAARRDVWTVFKGSPAIETRMKVSGALPMHSITSGRKISEFESARAVSHHGFELDGRGRAASVQRFSLEFDANVLDGLVGVGAHDNAHKGSIVCRITLCRRDRCRQ
jgi:hypothetical protein